MKTIYGVKVIESIDDFLHDDQLSNQFYTWSGDKDGDFINEPERAERCHDAAAFGGDGKLHCEAIEDFREFGDDLLREAFRTVFDDFDSDGIWDTNPVAAEAQLHQLTTELECCEEAFHAACNDLEQWHIKNGSYEQQIG